MVFYFVGILLTVVGVIYLIFPSKNRINKYGYRTQRAKLSEASYTYAQKVAGKTFFFIGAITLLIGLVLRYFGMIHLYIIEVLLIGVPIIGIFYKIELELEKFHDKQEEDVASK
ncbi:SdpI family protein [Vagococcus hydrophili]|uniref:SdpI family protein n=1 Tax=Vagococcus hydrophili TaxID=2714947 RepID=A0A6G8AVJ5_9ENTE|nr:SdpI family protein [Vagococcus hydrophili]QIL49111.1 SdpI family protein [Vagococcus hydrophili]